MPKRKKGSFHNRSKKHKPGVSDAHADHADLHQNESDNSDFLDDIDSSSEEEDSLSKIEASHLYGKTKARAVETSKTEGQLPDLKSAASDFQKKQQIALLGSQITQSGVDKAKLVEGLKGLHEFCMDSDNAIKKLALLSQCAVFKDILPGYRIRETYEESSVKISKEVRQLRDYETTLVTLYKRYIKVLEDTLKVTDPKSGLYEVAVRCICQLLETHLYFNCSGNLIAMAVPLLVSPVARISQLCCTTVTNIFKTDVQQEVSLQIIKLISSFIKSKSYNVPPQILDTLLCLRVNDFGEDKDTEHQPKGKRKAKEEKQVDKEMAESQAIVSSQKKVQSDIIKNLFLMYFRILKKAPFAALLPSVFSGIAKFSHLINVEVVFDLLKSVQNMLRADPNSNVNQFHIDTNIQLFGMLAVFKVLKHHETMEIDLRDFYSDLYTAIMKVTTTVTTPNHNQIISNLVQCLDLMLVQRKQTNMERVGSFIKRLCTTSLQLPTHSALCLLCFTHTLFLKYPRTQQLIDTEEGSSGIGIGIFLAEADLPEHTNPFATKLYEVFLMAVHYHPAIARYCKTLLDPNANSIPLDAVKLLNALSPFYYSREGTKGFADSFLFPKVSKKRILSSNFPSKIEKTVATTPDFGGVYVQFKKSSMIKDLEKMNRFYQRCLTVKKSRTQSE